jgi:hypothetical protein
MPNPSSYPRTRAALAEFDQQVNAAWAALNVMPNNAITNGHVWQAVAIEERLGRAVGRAFGLDTADRNSVSTCEGCVRPGFWLRNLLAQP